LFRCFAPAAQFVELKAEIEINNWSYWFFADARELAGGEPSKSVFTKSTEVRFLVGTNSWMMEGDFYSNASVTRWFTGTNIIDVINHYANSNPASNVNFPVVLTQPGWEKTTRVRESADGNPGRPVLVADLMDVRGKIGWLAFCSGPALKIPGRQVFPPDDLWKERCACSGNFNDKTVVFEDSLGLPKSMEIFTEKGQLILQYQIRQLVNVLGWHFPLEFYLVQYGPPHWPRTNSWEVEFTAKGKISSINVGAPPFIAPNVKHQSGSAIKQSAN